MSHRSRKRRARNAANAADGVERDLQLTTVMNSNPVWEDAQRTAEDIRVQVHLARMDARDRWHALELRLAELEKSIADSGEHVSDAVSRELADVQDALLHLRDEVVTSARGDYVTGW